MVCRQDLAVIGNDLGHEIHIRSFDVIDGRNLCEEDYT